MAYNILIVDDSVLTRTAIKRILGMIDIPVGRILEAADGLAALNLLDTEPVDLVLADLNMPQMSGIEMIHQMRQQKNRAQVPVVMVTTESSSTRIKELLSEGVRDYLHKPFTPEEFRSVISRYLGVQNDSQ
ncbi:MAG: response regulator [Phycisphaerae bacterium]|nr:response regulator [Phycisphaerae bacterium]